MEIILNMKRSVLENVQENEDDEVKAVEEANISSPAIYARITRNHAAVQHTRKRHGSILKQKQN